MEYIILGLGSNVGNKIDNIKLAIDYLTTEKIITKCKISKIYESKALLPEGSPESWDINFLNLAVAGTTNYEPVKLLAKIKQIEQKIGRIDRGKWSPREIDIDILIYGNHVIKTDKLIIPHQFLVARPFALIPASELAPDWKYPVEGNYYKKKLRTIVNLSKIDNTIYERKFFSLW